MSLEVDVPLEPEVDASVAAARAFSFLTGAELAKPLPPREYFVDTLLPKGSIVLFGGAGSSAKTWLATALAVGLGRGVSVVGCAAKKMQTGILDFEQGEYESRRRIKAINDGFGASDHDDGIGLCCHPPYQLASPEFYEALEGALAHRRFIAIDSLRAATRGIDENESNIRSSIDAVRSVPGAENSCVAFIVHARKGGGDLREQLRGSSAIFDAADVVFMLSAEDDGFAVKNTKNRFGSQLPAFGFRLEDTPAGGVSLVRTSLATNARASGVDRHVLSSVRRAVYAEPGLSLRKLRTVVGGHAAHVDDALRELIAQGAVARRGRLGIFPVPGGAK